MKKKINFGEKRIGFHKNKSFCQKTISCTEIVF